MKCIYSYTYSYIRLNFDRIKQEKWLLNQKETAFEFRNKK